ncbi:dihydropteroate synthase-like protein [Rhodoligotrophos appendicifer]
MADLNFRWSIVDIGVKVAALMTEAIIERRLMLPPETDKVILPGRARVDLGRLKARFGVVFERGPDELVDLPRFLGRVGPPPDLSAHAVRIFAEIVDAPALAVDAVVARGLLLRSEGADVIDLGCLPGAPFPHLEDAVRELKAAGLQVSVDSADPEELERGAKAGADWLLSLNRSTLSIAQDTGAAAILIPEMHGDMASLFEAMEMADRAGISWVADPILDPIHFGFMDSLSRYAELRRTYPDAPILMGTGNLTELTDADTGGVTAMLMGICSELDIANVLVVHVSPHTRRTIQEHDISRRIMHAARRDHSLPRDYSSALLQLHDRIPYASTPAEVATLARQVRDRNFRIEVTSEGIHIYNADGHHVAGDAMSLFPKLGVEQDGAHAFYLGTELMKAETAFRLGKRYAQDEPLNWGVAVDQRSEDKSRLAEAGHTLRAKTKG